MDGKVRSIVETHPVEAGCWDSVANGKDASEVTCESEELAWWADPSGRRWRDRVCDVCSRWFEDERRRPHASRNVRRGVNDLQTTDPDLAKEWDRDLNGSLRPEDVTRGNRSCVHWIDALGHRWLEEVNNRSHGNGCPVCSGRKLVPGVNDLATVRPDVAADWDYGLNGDLTPQMFTESSMKKVHWVCAKGHRQVATVHDRSRGLGCPVCAELGRTKRLAESHGSLADTGAPFLKEWAYDLNASDLRPKDLRPNSLVKVWWRCSKGHVWEASVHNRWQGSECPYCVGNGVSFCEKAVAFYVEKAVPIIENYHASFLGHRELDIYIPSLSTAIEYDGANFHQDVNSDMRKDSLCSQNGISLIRLREAGCPPIDDGCVVVQMRRKFYMDFDELSYGIRETLSELTKVTGHSFDVDVDVARDKLGIRKKMDLRGYLRIYSDKTKKNGPSCQI